MEKYTYAEFKAWKKVNSIMGISIDEAEPNGAPAPEKGAKNEAVSADTKLYLSDLKIPNAGMQGKSLNL